MGRSAKTPHATKVAKKRDPEFEHAYGGSWSASCTDPDCDWEEQRSSEARAQAAADAHTAEFAPEPVDEDENEDEPTFEARAAAIATHEEANALAEELGVDGFEAKKPNLDEKRAALLEPAQARDADAAAAAGSEES